MMHASTLDLREPAQQIGLRVAGHPAGLRAYGEHTWRARMVNEYMSADVFAALSSQLAAAGFARKLVDEAAQFAAEERRHGVLCGAVVEALGGEAVARVPERPAYPWHAGDSARVGVLRNVIHICCMSETVAVALIGAERLEMPAGPLRELLTGIYADEVGHARFGWALLEEEAETLTASEREAIERYLPVAFAHLEEHELLHLPERDAPPGGPI